MFKRLSDKKEVDLIKYVKNYLLKNDDVSIGIATDSISHGNKIKYATVIVLYRKGKGGHVLFKKNVVTRKLYGKSSKTDFQKLYTETEHTQKVVEQLKEFVSLMDVHLDFNADPKYFSNNVLLASIGWFKAMGVEVKGKPCTYAQVADKVVRGL